MPLPKPPSRMGAKLAGDAFKDAASNDTATETNTHVASAAELTLPSQPTTTTAQTTPAATKTAAKKTAAKKVAKKAAKKSADKTAAKVASKTAAKTAAKTAVKTSPDTPAAKASKSAAQNQGVLLRPSEATPAPLDTEQGASHSASSESEPPAHVVATPAEQAAREPRQKQSLGSDQR